MNRVTCVSGLRQEGKTTELVNEFKDLSERLYCDQEKSFKAHFIICVAFDIDHGKWLEKFKDFYNIAQEEIEFGSRVIIVNNQKELLEELTELVKSSDCKVFIDDPDTIIEKSDFNGEIKDTVSKVFEVFVDNYPNKECGNSIDITYTRLRIKE